MSSPSYSAAVRPRATMKQVAALAGVGTKTVSRVINHEPNVAAATATKVWDAIRALDYHVDLQAGSLRRAGGRTHTLGLLVGSVDNPFASAIHRAIEDVALPREVAVFASSFDDDPEREALAVSAFMRRRVDGLILTTASQRPGYLGSVTERGLPVVFVDRSPLDPDLDVVTSDNHAGAVTATEHLIRAGHRRIALLTDRLDIQTARERQRGFLEALGRAGISTTLAPMVTELHDESAAQAALRALLAADEPPTAVFSAQNLVTVGAVRALREAGLERSVALVGFDDIPLGDLLDPGVTVVTQDPQQIGEVAAQRMFARLSGDTSPPRHTVIPTALVERGSGEILPPVH